MLKGELVCSPASGNIWAQAPRIVFTFSFTWVTKFHVLSMVVPRYLTVSAIDFSIPESTKSSTLYAIIFIGIKNRLQRKYGGLFLLMAIRI